MEKKKWDEGWGWTASNADPTYAFTKMLAAEYLLEKGLAGYAERRQTNWTTTNLNVSTNMPFKPPLSVIPVREPFYTYESGYLEGYTHYVKLTHAFVVNQDMELFHFRDQIITQGGTFTTEWAGENVTHSLPDPGKGKIHSITSSIDEEKTTVLEGLLSFYSDIGNNDQGLNKWNYDLRLWVFGRDPEGAIIIYHKKWYQPDLSWEVFTLNNLIVFLDPKAVGNDEVPTVIKELKVTSGEYSTNGTLLKILEFNLYFDIFIRMGTELYHFWKYGSPENPDLGWQAVNIQQELERNGINIANAEVHTRPVAIKVNSRLIYVYARNQHGALLEFTLTRIRKRLFDCCFRPSYNYNRWTMRNIDNEIATAEFSEVISYDPVAGEPVVTQSEDGVIHVLQRKTTPTYGLIHYTKINDVWSREIWWTEGPPSTSVALNSEINILNNSEPDLYPTRFPFFVNMRDTNNDFIHFYVINEGAYSLWNRENPSTSAFLLSDRTQHPQLQIQGDMKSTIGKFENWVEINAIGLSPASSIVRYHWVNRAGWLIEAPPMPDMLPDDCQEAWDFAMSENLPSLGWGVEEIPRSGSTDFLPGINNMLRLLDVVSCDRYTVRVHRMTRDRPWHYRKDYYRWAGGERWGFEYVPKDERGDSIATAISVYWDCQMKCPSFAADFPVIDRAATMIHEATHLNKEYRGSVSTWEHEEINEVDMDRWYEHGLWSIDPNSLSPTSHRHSMYQMDIEFLTDIGEFPKHNLPHMIWGEGVAQAGTYEGNIIDMPPWTPGEPRPLY